MKLAFLHIYTIQPQKRGLGQFGTMEVSQSLQVGFEILHQISVDWELAWLTVSKLSSLVALLGREVSQARRLSKALQQHIFKIFSSWWSILGKSISLKL